MKITGVTVMAAMVGTTVWAGALPAAERQVQVCMGYTEEDTPAKTVSSNIFAGIGVKILWYSPKQCPAEAIFITFSNETPAGLLPGALAYARPYEGTHIVVFYDRVKNRSGSVSSVLGRARPRDRPRGRAHSARPDEALRERHHEGAMDRSGLPTNDRKAAPVRR